MLFLASYRSCLQFQWNGKYFSWDIVRLHDRFLINGGIVSIFLNRSRLRIYILVQILVRTMSVHKISFFFKRRLYLELSLGTPVLGLCSIFYANDTLIYLNRLKWQTLAYRRSLTLSFIMLKTPQDFESMFGHFSRLWKN